MKPLLMHRDRDLDLQPTLPPNHDDLVRDLELETLLGAMAGGDELVLGVARASLLAGLGEPEAILYRQRALADCLAQPAVVRDLYALAGDALEARRRAWRPLFTDQPDSVLSGAVMALEVLLESLRGLRAAADEHIGAFRSDAFHALFATIQRELGDAYLELVEDHLRELRFRRGVLLSARLGTGNKGTGYVLRRPRRRSWVQRIAPGRQSGLSFRIADRDEAGFRALGQLRGRGINEVANALAQSTDHVLAFFAALRGELAFYVGCLNLHAALGERGVPTCLPTPRPAGTMSLCARALHEPCLSLELDAPVVGSDLAADGRSLVMITGANQGGKSTFLRSVGLAQLMMQSGMFVAAGAFRADVANGLFTHFKREEDASMVSGKLDEELARMSDIAEQLGPHAVLLCNESFAATNEREGSEIARQVIRALTDAGVRVLFVTHLYDLAHGLFEQDLGSALFLRAERRPDGRRTFRLVEGEPLPTSYGDDAFRRVFGVDPGAAPVAALHGG